MRQGGDDHDTPCEWDVKMVFIETSNNRRGQGGGGRDEGYGGGLGR